MDLDRKQVVLDETEREDFPVDFVRARSLAEKSRLPAAGDLVMEQPGEMGRNDRHILAGE